MSERRSGSLVALSEDAARDVLKRLYGKVWNRAGACRMTGKKVGMPIRSISTGMRPILDDARNWHQTETCEPPENKARIHHELVRVRPFANGDGRRAGIMADIHLARIDPNIVLNWSDDRR